MSDNRFPDKVYTKEEIQKANSQVIHKFPNSNTIEIVVEKLSTIKPKSIEWLWQDIIASGKITLFAGEPGVGKSQLLLYIAMILSTGGKFHFENKSISQSKVMLIAGEDNMDDTVIPRLAVLGANIENIEYIKGIKKLDKKGREYYEPISLGENISELEDKIIESGCKIVIIDPISVYLGNADENKNKEIRSILAQLSSLCERQNISIIINSHFTKPSGNVSKNAIYRVMGSVGFAAAARIVYGIIKDPENPDRRLFLPIKNNIAQDKEGFAFNVKFMKFKIDSLELEASRIEWLNERVTQSANEVLNKVCTELPPKLEKAVEFLSNLLKDGSVPLSKIRTEAALLDISAPRLYKAKEVLNVYETESFGNKRGKIWMLGACTP